VRSDLISSISTSALTPRLDDDPTLFLLDVREPDEVAQWQIPGAHNIPLASLENRRSEIPGAKEIVLVCAKGTRAEQGAQILAEHGIASSVLEGGMSAWANTYDHVAGDFGGATIVQVRRRGKGCLSYVLGAGDRAVVIDPSLDLEQYQSVARDYGWRIADVVDTHLHADHVSGVRQLADATGATLWLNPADDFVFDFAPLEDGRAIELAEGVSLTVSSVSVPGHTEGSTMYQLGDYAMFTGDTLFLESVGRPDLADQAELFARHLYRSLHERVLTLSDDAFVFPAHYGAGVSIHFGEFLAKPLGALRKDLAVLSLDEKAFVDWALANVKDRPDNYKSIVLINSGRAPLSEDVTELEAGPNRCAVA
jgi:glyoxylase-like metal-dependent hydrolase (beta-lactamase superfamily II)/rhodanese-related sulfurtransferase